jgi:hypothetical protein
MITNRSINLDDYTMLDQSISLDEYHKDTPAMFFYEPGTVCSVYSDDKGIVLFVRGQAIEVQSKKVIKLDIQFLANYAGKRNLKTMQAGFVELSAKANDNGFDAFVFESTQPLLRNFCKRRLGFEEVPDFPTWLVKPLDKKLASVVELGE